MKSLIFLINFLALLIFAIHGFALYAGLETEKLSIFVFMALICVAQALKEIDKRLNKIEEAISKETDQPGSDQ